MMAASLDLDMFANDAPAGDEVKATRSENAEAANDYWKGFRLPASSGSKPWLSPEDQNALLIKALDSLSACPCCRAALTVKEWANGRMSAGPGFRGRLDSFRWKNDALSAKFECGLFLAVDENVCLSAHHPCLTSTGEAVQQLFDAALQSEAIRS